ncbi:unnamed protein product, partial [Brassica rapa]
MRLQAVEADKESMKRRLLSMRTEKAQMIVPPRPNCSTFFKRSFPSLEVASTESIHYWAIDFHVTPVFKVHVWDVSKQHEPTNASRKGLSITAMEMSQEHASVK